MENIEILDVDLHDENLKPKVELIDSNKFIILSLLTFGVYDIWWMFKTWTFFKKDEGLDIMPWARALFMIFFLHSLFDKINLFTAPHVDKNPINSTPLFLGYILFNFLGRLPDPFWLISLLGFFVFNCTYKSI